MLMTAGDKDSSNVTASCPHAAHFLISVTSPFARLMCPYELASFRVSATKKALRNACV